MSEHFVSYSSLVRHRKCPQSWHYRYQTDLVKLEKDETAVARDLGTWWHMIRAANSIERGIAKGSLRWVPEKLKGADERWLPVGPLEAPTITVEQVFELIDLWWEKMPEEFKEVWVKEIGEPAPDRLRYLDARYHERWDKELAQEAPLAVELKWRRELPPQPQVNGNPPLEHDTAAGGYIDEVYFDEKRHLVVARDHKSTGWLSATTVVDDMMDSQLQFYAWGGSPMVQEWGLGPIRGVAYDRVNVTKPTTPKLTQSGKLSTTTTRYDLTTYLAWVAKGQNYPGLKKDGSGAGTYEVEDDVVRHLTSPSWLDSWHVRSLTPLNKNLIRVHLRSAIDSAVDVIRTKERVAATGEAARNLTGSCKGCDYVKLCRTEMVAGPGGEYDYAEFGLRDRKAHDE